MWVCTYKRIYQGHAVKTSDYEKKNVSFTSDYSEFDAIPRGTNLPPAKGSYSCQPGTLYILTLNMYVCYMSSNTHTHTRSCSKTHLFPTHHTRITKLMRKDNGIKVAARSSCCGFTGSMSPSALRYSAGIHRRRSKGPPPLPPCCARAGATFRSFGIFKVIWRQ